MTAESRAFWLCLKDRVSIRTARAFVSVLALAVAACGAPAAQDEAAAPTAYNEPPPVVASVDQSAFSQFARGLESGSEAAPADVRVNLPILGVSVPRGSGLESSPDGRAPQQDYASDQTGNWYAQVTETPFGRLVVRGSLLRRADTVSVDAPVPTIESPAVTLGADDVLNEAHGQFVLGGVSYAVSLYCAPDQVEVCTDEASVREVVASLGLIEQERAQ